MKKENKEERWALRRLEPQATIIACKGWREKYKNETMEVNTFVTHS